MPEAKTEMSDGFIQTHGLRSLLVEFFHSTASTMAGVFRPGMKKTVFQSFSDLNQNGQKTADSSDVCSIAMKCSANCCNGAFKADSDCSSQNTTLGHKFRVFHQFLDKTMIFTKSQL